MNPTVVLTKKLKKFSDEQLAAFISDERLRVGLNNLYYHNKHILGYKDMTENTHGPMCEFIEHWNGKRKKLFIAPRNSFKSSLDVIGYSLQLIAKDPAIKILIVSEIEDNSKKYLAEIQNHLSSNKTYKEVYSHLYRDYTFNVWNTTCINLVPNNDVEKIPTGEHTIDIAGIGTPKVGLHYDFIFFVDPHSERNVRTKEQIEKVIVYYKLLNNILKAGTGRLIVEMTRWHHFDLAKHILENEADLFNVMVKSCFNPDGSLFFPELLSKQFLEDQRKTLGSYLFSCNYLGNPQSENDKVFKPEIARFYKGETSKLRKILFLDPSISEREDADDFAMVLLGVDLQNTQCLVDKKKIGRKQPAQAVAEIIAFMETHVPEPKQIWEIAIETVSFQRIYKFELERELSKHGHVYRIIELKPGGRAKKSRIMGLQSFWENGKLLLRAGTADSPSPDLDILLQFESFPLGKDDFIDAWAYILDVIQPKKHQEEDPSKMSHSSYQRRVASLSGRQSSLKRRYC